MRTIGWFGEDVIDFAGDAVSSAWDLVDDLPGLAQLGDGVKALVTGPLRDFAGTTLGQTVFRAMATMASGGVGAALMGTGPFQVFAMMSAHALPGIARGESFDEAILIENLWRLEKTAEILGDDAAAEAATQLGAAASALKERIGERFGDVLEGQVPDAVVSLVASSGLDPEAYARKLAAELGIREDFAAQALQLALRSAIDLAGYDPITGRRKGVSAETIRARAFSDRVAMTAPRTLDALRSRPVVSLPLSPSVQMIGPGTSRVRAALGLDAPTLDRLSVPIPDGGAPSRSSSGLAVAGVVGAGALGAWLLWRYL